MMIALFTIPISPEKAFIHAAQRDIDSLDDEHESIALYVEDMPEPVNIVGKAALPYVNPQTLAIWYEYEDLPPEFNPEKRILQLEEELRVMGQKLETATETIDYLLGV